MMGKQDKAMPIQIPNPSADAVIVFENGQLHRVVPPIAYKNPGGIFLWCVVPPGSRVHICFKTGYEVPFKDWGERCREGEDEISGTLMKIKSPPREFGYSVYDPVNDVIIDPIIRVPRVNKW